MTGGGNITDYGTHYIRQGAGSALIFIHGAGGNAAVWYQQVEAFAQDNTVICMDLPGFGLTPPRDGGFDPETLGEIVLEVMDHAGIETASLVGQSLGGWFALRAAIESPQRVKRLILSCSMAGVAHPPAIAAFTAALASMGLQGLAELTLSEKFLQDSAAKAYLFRQMTAFNTAADPAAIGPLFAPPALVPEEQLAAIDRPVLMISGGDDPIWPPDSLIGIAAEFPEGSQQVIKDCGHSPYFERPEQFNALLAKFLPD